MKFSNKDFKSFGNLNFDSVEKINKGINLIKEGIYEILFENYNNTNDWVPVENELPSPEYDEVEVTAKDGKRYVACYLEKHKVWMDSNFNKLDVMAWKKPSEPYTVPKTPNANEDRIIAEGNNTNEDIKKISDTNETDLDDIEEAEYRKFLRKPQDYQDYPVIFSGRVIQFFENISIDKPGTYNAFLISTEIEDRILYVFYNNSVISDRLLENDEIIVSGKYKGIHKYTSIAHSEKEVPCIEAEIINFDNY